MLTNTLPLPAEKQFDKIEVLSIAPLIADALNAVFDDTCVSEIFGGENQLKLIAVGRRSIERLRDRIVDRSGRPLRRSPIAMSQTDTRRQHRSGDRASALAGCAPRAASPASSTGTA